MHPLRPPAAVLVGLDLDECRLDGAAQPWDGPGVRVGLLEVVDRPHDEQLAELLELGSPCEVRRESRFAGRFGELVQRGDHLGGGESRRVGRHQGAQRGLEALLQPRPQRHQVGVPLPAVVNALQAAVVQLVEHRERQLDLVVAQDVLGG